VLHRLEELTSPAAGELGRAAGTIGLVVTGAIEQHGPHLPVSMDTAVARALRERVPGLLDCDVLSTPVIDVAMSDPQIAYPGTITLSEEVFAQVVLAHLTALARTGITRIALIDFNSPNTAGSARAVRLFADERPDVTVIHQDDAQWLTDSLWRNADDPAAVTPDHAGRIETSLGLALYPDGLVGEFADVVGYTAFDEGDWWGDLLAHGTEYLSPVGVLGVPAGASRAEGERVLDALVHDYAAWIDGAFSVGLRP
jgi:creatinine amidohydrolase/Fe(II)-dependent formamide hydrolase-like protein